MEALHDRGDGQARGKIKHGSPIAGPSGVGVWNAPTLDPERDTLYIGTGDNYSDPDDADERFHRRA